MSVRAVGAPEWVCDQCSYIQTGGGWKHPPYGWGRLATRSASEDYHKIEGHYQLATEETFDICPTCLAPMLVLLRPSPEQIMAAAVKASYQPREIL